MKVYHETQVPWPARKPVTIDRKYGTFRTGGWPIKLAEGAQREKAVIAFSTRKEWRTTELWIYAEGQLGAKGRFLANQRTGLDPRVVVSFDIDGVGYLIAVDRLNDAAQNLAAIAAYIEGLRAQERYGIFTAEELLQNFAALPPPASPFDGLKSEDEIVTLYRKLAKDAHPDHGGTHETFTQLLHQRDEAIRRLG